MHYKQVENGIILSIGTLEVANNSLTEITETEYENLLAIMRKAPQDGAEYGYHLSAETLQYEFYVKPREEAVDWYVGKILNEEMTIDEIPETYREEVQAKLPVPPEQTYTLDEAATILVQEVSAIGYNS